MKLKYGFAFVLFFCTFFVYAETFQPGKDYEILQGTSQLSHKANPITVTEFFSYGCPWCFRLETSLSDWVKKQGSIIQFSRVPVVFNPDWVYYARAYYTLHLLKQEQVLGSLLFKAIQVDKQPLNSNEAMINFLVSHGIDKPTAESAFEHSTTIDMEVTAGTALMTKYRITGVPALVVNGRFKTDLQMAKSEERLFKILDFLLSQ